MSLTIVMYHYVRPLARSRYPGIKGLDIGLFDRQLDYIQRHYNVVSMDDVLASLDQGVALPPRALLLTFDDGYIDHYTYVLPRLVERGVTGAFFPPACAVQGGRVLDVNKIHFLLASGVRIDCLVDEIEAACRQEWGVEALEAYRARFWQPNVFDPAPVNYVKRMLQVGLPERFRAELVDRFFSRWVSADEAAFAEELYVNVDQLRLMVSLGMHVGSHGDRHEWLGSLEPAEQERDIEHSLDLLGTIGMSPEKRTMCYPYGSFNDDTVAVLRAKGFKAALTTAADLAMPAPESRFCLPRLDTNHLPKDGDAAISEWTLRA